MRKLTLLFLLVSAMVFGQTNTTFNNLDVRNTTKLRGLIYPFGAVATSPINTAVHEIAMINNTTFALCRMDFEEFADSIAANIGLYWSRTGNYLYPKNLPDSVGIGTDTPTEQFSVQGNASISDTAYIGKGWIWMDSAYYSGSIKKGNLAIGSDYVFLGAGYPLNKNTGDINTAIGTASLANNTTGSSNTAVGYGTLGSNITSSSNVSIGSAALGNSNGGDHNTAVGVQAMGLSQSGDYNVAIGSNALIFNDYLTGVKGNNNVAIGFGALSSGSMGSNNIGIGYRTGYHTVGGSIGDSNIFIGHKAGSGRVIGSNKLYIENSNADSTGALIFGNFATDRITFNADIIYGQTHWDDLTIPAAQAKIGANNKPVYDFDSLALKWDATDTTTNYTAHNFQLRHAYAPSTSIYPHVHYWQHTASDTCEWMILLYRWTDIGETRPAYTRIHTNNQTVRAYTSNTLHQIASFPAIVDGGAHTESSIFDCKLYVYSNGVLYTSQLDIHFEQNKPGTYNEYP